MKAYVLFEIRTGSIHEVVKNVALLEGVVEVHMTFGPYDAIALVEAENVKKMGRLVNVDMQVIPGVLKTLTCLAIE